MKQDVKKEQEEKKRLLWMFIKLVVMGLVLLFLLFTLLKEGIAWFASSTDATAGGMGIRMQNNGFEIEVDSGVIGYEELYDLFDPELTALTGENDTMTSAQPGEQVVIWRMEDGETAVSPGSQGTLEFNVISNGVDIDHLKYSISLVPYQATTHLEDTDDPLDPDGTIEVVDSLTEMTTTGSTGEQLSAIHFLNTHILFFTGRNGTSQEDYKYYGLIEDKEDFELALDNGRGTIYWIWPNTFGQIALESGDTDYIVGVPVLDRTATSYNEDRTALTQFMMTNAADFFVNNGTDNYSSLINTMYTKWNTRTNPEPVSYKTEFEKLSEGYNAADQTIGSNVDYFLIRMAVNAN